MKNIGVVDRGIRFVLGLVLIVAAFAFAPVAAGWSHWAVLVVGGILVLTAIIGFCPAYLPFGIRTCAARRPG